MEAIGALYIVLGAVFLLVLAVLWACMPFAIFGTKDKLQTLIEETRANTAAIKALHETIINK